MSNITLLLSSILGSRGGATPTYTISGTVSGDVAEGVTITLTGDASDSTTTAGDGTYSFTVLDGSYNVEPSFAGYTFSPTDTDVAVSGGDQTGNDFTSTLSLPFTVNVSDFSDGVASASEGWRQIIAGTEDFGTIVACPTDSNSYTPSGVTKAAQWNSGVVGAGSYNGMVYKFPNGAAIDDSLTGFRIAALVYSPSGSIVAGGTASEDSITDDGTALDFMTSLYATTTVPDNFLAAQYIGGVAANSNVVSPVNQLISRWVWVRIEADEDGTQHMSLLRAEDSSSLGTADLTMAFTMKPYEHIGVRLVVDAGYTDLYLAALWAGKKTDDWPTSTVGSTTLTW